MNKINETHDLGWTGERLVPTHTGDTAIEHLHRYAFAAQYAAGKDVLDIACGEGYGSKLLASVAKSVTGVDIAPDAINHAKSEYGSLVNVQFQIGTCTKIPMEDSSVDLVISFETLEHIAEHHEMLVETKRVLRDEGTLIISTPDALYCRDIPQNFNPFHVKELYKDEFISLMKEYFSFVDLFDQRICHASVINPAEGVGTLHHFLGDFNGTETQKGIKAPLFNLAVATDDSRAVKKMGVTLFEGRGIPTEVDKKLADAEVSLLEIRSQLAKTKTDLSEVETSRADLGAELMAARKMIDQLRPRSPDAQVLSVGVVTFNNPDDQLSRLAQTIDLAAEQLDPEKYIVRLFSIDCGAPSRWSETRVEHSYLEPRGNIGFGAGMNRLMAAAFSDPKTSSFVCCNPDGRLHRDLLKEMVLSAETWPNSLIEARQFPEEHPKPYDLVTGLTEWASGACVLIPRAIYRELGGYDENIFMYMEDVDFGWRVRGAGFSVRIAPRALFSHSVLDRKSNKDVERYCYESARYLAYKWRKPREQEFYERIILERGYVTSLAPLPTVDHPADTSFANFDFGFAFSDVRWS